MMPSVYQTVFGGNPVAPAIPTYLALTFAVNTVLGWPLESNISSPAVAEWIDCTASAPALTLQLSDARQVSTGYTAIFDNVGGNTFTVLDAQGNTLFAPASGAAWILVLADNSTLQGTWRALQLGAGVSVANAAALAGNGLKAIATTLNERIAINTQSSNYAIQASDRASCIEWTSGSGGVFTAPSAATVGADWFCYIKNAGTGSLTLSGTIDGSSGKTFNPNDSCILVSDGATLFTMGFGQSVASSFNFVTISLAGASGNVTLSGAQLNRISYRFTGALAGNTTVIVPASIQQYWVDNETTGAFTLVISAGAGTFTVPQGSHNILYCDGVNIVNAVSAGGGGTTLVADGSAAAPGLAWASDTQMGLYKAGTDVLGISTAGVARGSVNATGNWTVNVPSTGVAVTVNGAAANVVAGFVGGDVGVVNITSSAATNRALTAYVQAGVNKGRVGVDGSSLMLTDSANGDLCITSTGSSIRLGQQTSTTQVSINSTGNVVVSAPSSGVAVSISAAANFSGIDVTQAAASSTYALRVFGSTTAGSSLGLVTKAGTNASDFSAAFQNQAGATLMNINGAGNVLINAPTSGIAHTVNGLAGQITVQVSAGNVTQPAVRASAAAAGGSFNGLQVLNTSATGFSQVQLTSNSVSKFIRADQNATLEIINNAYTVALVSITDAGNVTVHAPTGGAALTVNGVSNGVAGVFVGGSTASQSFGVGINAGTSSSDYAISITNKAVTSTYFQVRGDGLVQAVDDGGTLQAVGWRGTPPNVQTINYTLQLSDRGKSVFLEGAAGQTVTVPNAVFSAGDVVTLVGFNGTNAYTVVQGSGFTLYWGGNGVTTGSRTLTSVGVATVVFQSSSAGIISGAVS